MMPALATATGHNIWGRPIAVRGRLTNRFNSDVATADTIGILQRLAHQYAFDPSVAAANTQAFAYLGVAPSDRDVACAIFHWLRANIRFVEDETLMYEELGVAPENLDKELLIVPPLLLNMPVPMGDCDDFSLLAACMLMNAGVRAYFVTVAADASEPGRFSHIYVCARLEDENSYMCLDAGNQLVSVPPGWESSNVMRKAIWAI